MKELTLTATLPALERVLAFVEETLSGAKLAPKLQMQLAIAVEELYVNIARYAYTPQTGEVTIRCGIEGDPPQAVVQFVDGGMPYNPLTREDPDITLDAQDREIGGLGIFMVKKSMDEMTYAYVDGKNILTIKKTL